MPQVEKRRTIILTDGYSDPVTTNTNTVVSMIRYCNDEIAAILNRENAVTTPRDLFGVGRVILLVCEKRRSHE